MDYETLYNEYLAYEKAIKEKIKLVTKLQKAIAKNMDSGDLFKSISDTELLHQASDELSELTSNVKALLSTFDAREYMESGLFAQQLLSQCEQSNVDVIGDFPVYEMFPYKVRFDVENQEAYLDRKKVSCLRPSTLVSIVKAGQEKLYKASFRANQFASELASAYDLACLKLGKEAGADIYLTTLYKYLVPMSRSRKEYDQQSYAFDIARLFDAQEVEVKGGRSFQFGPSRNNSKALRILDQTGREYYLATIRFY